MAASSPAQLLYALTCAGGHVGLALIMLAELRPLRRRPGGSMHRVIQQYHLRAEGLSVRVSTGQAEGVTAPASNQELVRPFAVSLRLYTALAEIDSASDSKAERVATGRRYFMDVTPVVLMLEGGGAGSRERKQKLGLPDKPRNALYCKSYSCLPFSTTLAPKAI